jgi:vacuole membrane protein 1
MLFAAFTYLPGPHDPYRNEVKDFTIFALYWIGLGVASSIGLGTGLHTFVLYLGPHIAQVTLAANECNRAPVQIPSRWRFDHFQACEPLEGDQYVSFLTVYYAVCIEAFLWGAGTCLGELPPYFVAKAASMAGKTPEELEDLLESGQSSEQVGIVGRLKLRLL